MKEGTGLTPGETVAEGRAWNEGDGEATDTYHAGGEEEEAENYAVFEQLKTCQQSNRGADTSDISLTVLTWGSQMSGAADRCWKIIILNPLFMQSDACLIKLFLFFGGKE